jgi:phosphate transport system substrate-binding protein
MSSFTRKWGLLLVFGLGGCVSATPTPGIPEITRIGTTPSFTHVVDGWLEAFHDAHPDVYLSVEVFPDAGGLGALEQGEIATFISGNLPAEDLFLTPIAIDAVAVIANPSLNMKDLNREELRALFSGRIMNWDQLGMSPGPVELVIPLRGDAVRNKFEEVILGDEAYSSGAFLGPTPAAVVELVESTPGAIGILPLSFTGGEDLYIAVEGTTPTILNVLRGKYSLVFDLIAIALEEPSGDTRLFVQWVQEEQFRDD